MPFLFFFPPDIVSFSSSFSSTTSSVAEGSEAGSSVAEGSEAGSSSACGSGSGVVVESDVGNSDGVISCASTTSSSTTGSRLLNGFNFVKKLSSSPGPG